jgi:hypothetical protein
MTWADSENENQMIPDSRISSNGKSDQQPGKDCRLKTIEKYPGGMPGSIPAGDLHWQTMRFRWVQPQGRSVDPRDGACRFHGKSARGVLDSAAATMNAWFRLPASIRAVQATTRSIQQAKQGHTRPRGVHANGSSQTRIAPAHARCELPGGPISAVRIFRRVEEFRRVAGMRVEACVRPRPEADRRWPRAENRDRRNRCRRRKERTA